MARRTAAFPVALAALLTLLVGSCSAGVPPTGRVASVSTVQLPHRYGGQSNRAEAPPRNASIQTIASGFMTAMSAPHRVNASSWVSREPKAEARVAGWKADRPLEVYESFSPGDPVRAEGQATVPITYQVQGRLDGNGDWTPEAGERRLDLRLRDGPGGWRVANPPEIPLVERSDFDNQLVRAETFFVTPDRRHVTPVQTFVTAVGGVQSSVAERTRQSLVALLAGPRGRSVGVVRTAIPAGTVLRSFSLDGGTAVVNLSAAFESPGGLSGRLRLGQVVWTVTRAVQASEVLLRVEGRSPHPIGPDRVDASGRLRRSDQKFATLWPERNGNRSALLFVRSSRGQAFSLDPNALDAKPVALNLDAGGQVVAPTWSPGGDRIAFLSKTGIQKSLWVTGPRGRPARSMGLSGDLSAPSWMPDGSRVLVLRHAGSTSELWAVTPDPSPQLTMLRLAALPDGFSPSSIAVSPDGVHVLTVGVRKGAPFQSGGALFLGFLAPADAGPGDREPGGVIGWTAGPVAAGLGSEIDSPVWVDPTVIAFISRTTNADDLGQLWTMAPDGWDPNPVLPPPPDQIVNLGDRLSVDPDGARFVFTVRSPQGTSLYTIKRFGKDLRPLTLPDNQSDTDPSFASR